MKNHEQGAWSFSSGDPMTINGTGSPGNMCDVTDMDGFHISMTHGDPFSHDYSHRGLNGDTVNYQSISHSSLTVCPLYGIDVW